MEPDVSEEATVINEQGDAPTLIPGYEIIKTLGKGGMGMVYLARERGMLDRQVALKTILPKHVDPAFRKFFLQEGQRQADLHHPNILPIFAAGEAGEMLYLAMHFARDGCLRDRMDEGPLSVDQTVTYVADVLAALDHAHNDLDVPMAHLDIKPENLLFDRENVYVADFGIARQFAEDATVTNQVAGDPRYWAPEQQAGQADLKSDLYALGMMFFEMLAGERPPANLKMVTSKTQAAELTKRLPPQARKFGPLIAKCLDPDPAARPDAGELRRELQALQTPKRTSIKLIAAVLIVAAIGVALSQPTVREGIEEQWLTLFPPEAYPVSFDISPAKGKLFIDGQEETLRAFPIAEGEHRVVAVGAGYAGQTSVITVGANVAPVSFDLQPIPQLSDDEYLRFVQAFDGTDKAYGIEWQDPTLQNLVALDQWESENPALFAERLEELSALASAGDAIASTALFFAALEGLAVPGGPKPLIPGLVRASDEGYAIASLLRALYVMQSLFEAGQTFNSNPFAFEEVEALLKRASEQGLPRAAALVAGVAGISSIAPPPE